MMKKPLVTLILVSYKQERYIREAVASALAQTYSPLEIIISDDCSPDATFEIIKEVVAGYQGSHKIQLNRNERNLGLCGNFNRALALSQGEFIVGAAGDDISLPHRCQRLAEEWSKPGRRWHSICSDAEVIDENGVNKGVYLNLSECREINSVDQILSTGIVGISGCTHAFSREIIEEFGALNEQSMGEDELLGFRGLVLGGVRWIPDRLILYRRHSENTFQTAGDLKKQAKAKEADYLRKLKADCALGVELRRQVLQIAADRGRLSREKAGYYESALRQSHLMLEFIVYHNKRLLPSLACIIRACLTGKYRAGMFSLLEETHCPVFAKEMLRLLRKPGKLFKK